MFEHSKHTPVYIFIKIKYNINQYRSKIDKTGILYDIFVNFINYNL